MDNAQRRYIMTEARQTLDRLQQQDLERSVNALPDPAEMWKVRANERTRQRELAQAELAAMKQQPEFDWSVFDARVQSMIEAALATERRMLCESLGTEVGMLLAEERKDTMQKTRDELRELRIETAKLGSEVAELRALLAVERSNRTSTDTLTRQIN
jgi:hypothetical protein